MIEVKIVDETAPLKSVVLGVAESLGIPDYEEAYDPKSKEHIRIGTYPKEVDLEKELAEFLGILEQSEVQVFRPSVIEHYNQIFARDIGFVIDNIFISASMIAPREREIEGIADLIAQISSGSRLVPPPGARVEGGDVMAWGEYLFVGYSEKPDFDKYVVSRTNRSGVDFLKTAFPQRIVKEFELRKSDHDPRENALHLDCCFQPIGDWEAIIYPDGFKNHEDYSFLLELFGPQHSIEIDQEEMYSMNSNVFSLNPGTIVSEKGFTRLNGELRKRGYTVEEIKYSETAKMEGLLRCSTLPLYRK